MIFFLGGGGEGAPCVCVCSPTSPPRSPSWTGPWKKHPRTRPVAKMLSATFRLLFLDTKRTNDQSEDQLPWASSVRT